MATAPALSDFEPRFGHPPDVVVQAPGRINLIGDHTDYSGGLVLPMAIDRAVLVAARATSARCLDVYSVPFDQTARISLETMEVDRAAPWSCYVAGVLAMLRRQHVEPRGAEFWIGGDVPPGAGLASSAALEVGVALAMLSLASKKLPRVALATLCRQAEQECAGAPCGIMDQLCCVSARADHAMLIDCRSMMTQQVPLDLGEAALVVVDSGVRHSIAGAGYARRRRECAVALATLAQVDPRITSLRDVGEGRLSKLRPSLDETLFRRVRHVATENARVVEAAGAISSGDVERFGRLMTSSHVSLRDDFQASCVEVDDLVASLSAVKGVHGARMTGGGFGGCVIALVDRAALERASAAVRGVPNSRGDAREMFVVRPSDAARVLSNDG